MTDYVIPLASNDLFGAVQPGDNAQRIQAAHHSSTHHNLMSGAATRSQQIQVCGLTRRPDCHIIPPQKPRRAIQPTEQSTLASITGN
ncbi:MAG TPA: hypothetical protein VEM96_00795 [Pyrinomonadaceae bacterium]|nr:hypothetical protein [Pyrinomonadaceae bacterium]